MKYIVLHIGLSCVMFSRNVTLAFITIDNPIGFPYADFFIVKMARKYTNLQQKGVGTLNAYMEEHFTGQKRVIVRNIQEDMSRISWTKWALVRKNTFKKKMFSGILFPVIWDEPD